MYLSNVICHFPFENVLIGKSYWQDSHDFILFFQVGCFVKKFSKFTTINVSPFWGQKSRLLIILARERIKEMFFLYQLKFVQPEAGKRHAHKCWQIVCLIELTLPSAYCKQNWIAERSLVNRLAILARVFGEHFVF